MKVGLDASLIGPVLFSIVGVSAAVNYFLSPHT
jgi:hypothetical protein